MADQSLYLPNRLFTLDLHGVVLAEAARIIRTRLRECRRFGLYSLRVVYGSPDRFEGSILERLCEIVKSDDHVLTSELPEWVFNPHEHNLLPIFLVVPIKHNPNAEALDASAKFEKFKAQHEERPSQRLLCSMPFQPLRSFYDWNYAAHAIGKPCNAQDLLAFCSQTGKGTPESGGLSLQDLMYAADNYGAWAKQPKAHSQTSEGPSQTVRLPATNESGSGIIEDSTPIPIPRVLPMAVDLFCLIDRLLEEGDYARCVTILGEAERLCVGDDDKFEYAIRKGRILLRMHDASCETWLLKADEVCVKLFGEASPRRRNIIGMLQDWYCSSGEANRAIHYAEIAYDRFGHTLHRTREQCFTNDLVVAQQLRISGDLRGSGRVLTNAAWRYAFQKDGDAPVGFGFEHSAMYECGLPPKLLANFFQMVALNATDWGDAKGAWNGTIAAYTMAQKCSADPSLAARVLVEQGRIIRRFNNDSRIALQKYDEAEQQNNKDGAPDIYTRFLINLNRGVALAVSGEPRLARKAYARAEEDATEFFIDDHTELFKLFSNQSSLHLRRKEWDEAIEKATRASAILELKASDRIADIGRMHFWKGQAYLQLKNFEKAKQSLSDAEALFARAGNGISEVLRIGLQDAMDMARTGSAERFIYRWQDAGPGLFIDIGW